MQPELETAVDEIVNEAIVHDVTGKSVSIILDDLEQPDNIKEMCNSRYVANQHIELYKKIIK
jgi:hypothetical protein